MQTDGVLEFMHRQSVGRTGRHIKRKLHRFCFVPSFVRKTRKGPTDGRTDGFNDRKDEHCSLVAAGGRPLAQFNARDKVRPESIELATTNL